MTHALTSTVRLPNFKKIEIQSTLFCLWNESCWWNSPCIGQLQPASHMAGVRESTYSTLDSKLASSSSSSSYGWWKNSMASSLLIVSIAKGRKKIFTHREREREPERERENVSNTDMLAQWQSSTVLINHQANTLFGTSTVVACRLGRRCQRERVDASPLFSAVLFGSVSRRNWEFFYIYCTYSKSG